MMSLDVEQLKETLLENKIPSTQPSHIQTFINCHSVLTSRRKASHATPCCDRKILFSEIIVGKHEERYKPEVKLKQFRSAEEIKNLLKQRSIPST